MPEYYSDISDYERDLMTKIDQILEAVRDLQQRQRSIQDISQDQKQ